MNNTSDSPSGGKHPPEGLERDIYDLLTGDEDARVCRDIPDEACRTQPGNFLRMLISSLGSSAGDQLSSPKLVLPWLLTSLGAPAFMIGWLVPIRESLALLPQLVIAKFIRERPVRKWFWVVGSMVQGASIGAMGLVAMDLQGAAAGWWIIALLVVFSLARGVCSVAWKDVLGKTIAKTRRGTVSGYASSIAGAITIGVGLWATFSNPASGSTAFFVGLLFCAGAFWLLAALTYASLDEYAGATEGGGNAVTEALRQLRLLKTDRPLRRFIAVRTLLLSTALVGPFYVSLANSATDGNLSSLGTMMLASGIAAFLSAPMWGRMADRSSRNVMSAAAALATVTGLALGGFSLIAGELPAPVLSFALAWFALSVAHAGVRLGRKTHVVDIANADNRASYVAVSNTLIGLFLLAGGGLVSLLAGLGAAWVIIVLSLTSAGAAIAARGLQQAQ